MADKSDGIIIYLASEGYFHHLPYEMTRPDKVYDDLRLPGSAVVTDAPYKVSQHADYSGEDIRYLP